MSYQERVLVLVLILALVFVVLAALADKFDRNDRDRAGRTKHIGHAVPLASNDPTEIEAYEATDPKSGGYHSLMADVYDLREGK